MFEALDHAALCGLDMFYALHRNILWLLGEWIFIRSKALTQYQSHRGHNHTQQHISMHHMVGNNARTR